MLNIDTLRHLSSHQVAQKAVDRLSSLTDHFPPVSFRLSLSLWADVRRLCYKATDPILLIVRAIRRSRASFLKGFVNCTAVT